MDKMYCSINEASKATGATYNFIYNLCKDKKIAFARSGKKYIVNMESFFAYMELADGEPINATA